MAEETGQERSEQATPRRRQQAKDKGQSAQSRELNTMLMMLAGAGGISLFAPHIVDRILSVSKKSFSPSREAIFSTDTMILFLESAIADSVAAIAPLLGLLVIAAIAGPVLIGGVTFSPQAISFKWEKLDPISGLKRVFAWRGFVELTKALLKFTLIGSIAILFLYHQAGEYIGLGNEDVLQSLTHASNLLLWALLIISSSLILIALVDVPFQVWDHLRQLKMTLQEVKDENKDTEGNPEVRGRARRIQREMAQRRMMADVPDADVVITNPDHYSVALKYDQKKMAAPVVIAKGADLMALQIRAIAREHKVTIMQAPPLARSLYHTTKLGHEIPAGLYLAVAQVLAYVFKLRKAHSNYKDTHKMNDLPIPSDLKFN